MISHGICLTYLMECPQGLSMLLQMARFHSFLWLSIIIVVFQLCLTLCDPMNCSTPGLPSLTISEFVQVHVHCISVAVQPSHPLMPSVSSALNLPQHQGLIQWVVCSHQMTRILELQLQHQSFQGIFRADWRREWQTTPYTCCENLMNCIKGWVLFHCKSVSHVLYPFICWWTFRLFPCFGYCYNIAVNVGVHIAPWINVFIFFM